MRIARGFADETALLQPGTIVTLVGTGVCLLAVVFIATIDVRFLPFPTLGREYPGEYPVREHVALAKWHDALDICLTPSGRQVLVRSEGVWNDLPAFIEHSHDQDLRIHVHRAAPWTSLRDFLAQLRAAGRSKVILVALRVNGHFGELTYEIPERLPSLAEGSTVQDFVTSLRGAS